MPYTESPPVRTLVCSPVAAAKDKSGGAACAVAGDACCDHHSHDKQQCESHGRVGARRGAKRPSADPVLLRGKEPALAEGVTHLLKANRRWAAGMTKKDPKFFHGLANQQSPKYLWIGCSDSRVPANQILGLAPGEIFVHRNVANCVVHSDLNCLSATQFAVDVLHVEDILVVGHYGCGGVAAALSGGRVGIVDNWVRHVKDVRNKYRCDLWKLPDKNARLDLLCELNVIEQTFHLATSGVLKDQWGRCREVYSDPELLARMQLGFTEKHAQPQSPLVDDKKKEIPSAEIHVAKRIAAGRGPVRVHGMIYDVADGILHPLVTITYKDRAFERAHAAARRQIELYLCDLPDGAKNAPAWNARL